MNNIEVTLLSKKEIENPSKVLQKIGINLDKTYWAPDQLSYSLDIKCPTDEFALSSTSGNVICSNVCDSNGVRPVLKCDDVEVLIKGRKIEMKDGVQIVEYGKFPSFYEQVEIDSGANLKPTGKKYKLPSQKLFSSLVFDSFSEYTYGEKNVIEEYSGNGIIYRPVNPVKFAVDRENSMLISLGVLFRSPLNLSCNHRYNGMFETSLLYDYLNDEFIKCLLINEEAEKEFSQRNNSDFLQAIISENDELRHDIQRKKELLEKLKELFKENEALRLRSRNLDSEMEKVMGNNGFSKKLHL